MTTRHWTAGVGGVFALTALAGAGCERTLDGACNNLASAACDFYEACSPSFVDVSYGDRATCHERLAARCTLWPGQAGSKTTLDDIEACAAGYRTSSCDLLLGGRAPHVCRIAGNRSEGAECASDMQCASAFCAYRSEGRCGACATPLKSGDACAPGDGLCEAGLYCAEDARCTKYAVEGGPCGPDARCGLGLWCDAGKCAATLGEGAPCADPEACDLLRGLFCNMKTGDCARLEIASRGQTCGYEEASGRVSLCAAGADCSAEALCAVLARAGEPCTVSAGAGNCVTGLECISGRCTADFPACR
jgi:hypothetical protein